MAEDFLSNPNSKQLSLSPKEKVLFSQLAIHLSRAFIQTHTFGTEQVYAKEAIQSAFSALQKVLKDRDELTLCIIEGKLTYNQIPLEEKNLLIEKLIDLAAKTRLVSWRFKKDISEDNFKSFLDIFHRKPEEILVKGGVDKLVKEKGIANIDINPIKYELIGKEQKIVDDGIEIFEMDKGTDLKDSKEDRQLVRLIGETFKEETSPSTTLEKIKENTLQSADSLIEAVRIIDKIGMNESQPLVASIIKKIIFIKNELSISLDEDKVHDQIEGIKQFSKQIKKNLKLLNISKQTKPFVDEIANLNTGVKDRIEAGELLTGLNKNNLGPKEKVSISKSILQREKESSEYRQLVKDILSKKGFSEEEILNIIKEGTAALETKKKEKKKKSAKGLLAQNQELEQDIKSLTGIVSDLGYGLAILEKGRIIKYLNKKAENIPSLTEGKELPSNVIAGLKNRPETNPDNNTDVPQEAEIMPLIHKVYKDSQGNIEAILFKEEQKTN